MRFVSWNVNGIRSVLKKGFQDFVKRADADVICLQEVRAFPDQVGLRMPGYHAFWNPAERPGYSGTAIFARKAPLKISLGIGIPRHDGEGRIITAEYSDFCLVNVYTPNARDGLVRLPYRQEWDRDFLSYLKSVERSKPVVFCGDLNVAHKEIDLARPKENERNPGFTIEERAGFDNIIAGGFIDTFREFTKDGGHYTWWSYQTDARARNVGWRIDYFCISPALRPRLSTATILSDVMGSDHCPVAMTLE
ncbi:MAG TPA: exodeoxyribonuclease III [Candidatus Brocadiia bacterium]|nr:exodeoxyribonuclease III [Candidatus Brocadiia bacterium]